MKEEKEFKISYFAAHATTIVSVTLVLLLVGIIVMISVAAKRETKKIRESVELSAVMGDHVSDAQAASLRDTLLHEPFVAGARLITRDEALQSWKEDTGEDLMDVFGVNPLSPEIEFTLKEGYTNPDSIKSVSAKVAKMHGVEEVAAPDSELIRSMNDNIEALSVALGAVAIVMLIISYVLIRNTVKLTIYSRRFLIHTMQLVGATDGFISRPVVLKNMLAGCIAGLIVAAVMAVSLAAAPHDYFADLSTYFSWGDYAAIAGGLTAGGALICALAAWLATGRYLRKDYAGLVKS